MSACKSQRDCLWPLFAHFFVEAHFVSNLVATKLPIKKLGDDIFAVLIVVALLAPGGMVVWAWRRALKRNRRYRLNAIPAFLFPEIDAP